MTKPVFIVAEIGQNHNGSLKIAKQLIDMASKCKCDAVKFTKRDLDSVLTKDQQEEPYNNPNSFGTTYGKHRAFLELSKSDYEDLVGYCSRKRIQFFASVCDVTSADFMEKLDVNMFKIASRDVVNVALLKHVAQFQKPILLSTGMCTRQDLDVAVALIHESHRKLILLNCTAQYPTEYQHCNLNRIQWLGKRYWCPVGQSDHTVGIATCLAAVALGATVIEKHITLSRAMKGTDQKGSLEELGLMRLVRDIRNLEVAFGEAELPSELPAYVQKTRMIQIYRRYKQ